MQNHRELDRLAGALRRVWQVESRYARGEGPIDDDSLRRLIAGLGGHVLSAPLQSNARAIVVAISETYWGLAMARDPTTEETVLLLRQCIGLHLLGRSSGVAFIEAGIATDIETVLSDAFAVADLLPADLLRDADISAVQGTLQAHSPYWTESRRANAFATRMQLLREQRL